MKSALFTILAISISNLIPTHEPLSAHPATVNAVIEQMHVKPSKGVAKAEAVPYANTKPKAVKTAVKTPPQPKPATQTPGDCESWLRQAGVTELSSARELIHRESNCNPRAVNPSSGACGVAQELPCGKSGCSFGDGACQVKWMNRYTLDRYGSWANAVAFHNANNYY